MNLIRITLSQEALKNLFIFLNRVELKGYKEVEAFNEITKALKTPIIETDTDEIKTDKNIIEVDKNKKQK